MLQTDLKSISLINTKAQSKLDSLSQVKFETNALKVISQKDTHAKKYLQQTIIEMELQ